MRTYVFVCMSGLRFERRGPSTRAVAAADRRRPTQNNAAPPPSIPSLLRAAAAAAHDLVETALGRRQARQQADDRQRPLDLLGDALDALAKVLAAAALLLLRECQDAARAPPHAARRRRRQRHHRCCRKGCPRGRATAAASTRAAALARVEHLCCRWATNKVCRKSSNAQCARCVLIAAALEILCANVPVFRPRWSR